jgi:CMP-N-acetylneuraminic acid synthetase
MVPARRGSKGLPGKSMMTVGGLSLVARAVKVALEADIFDDVCVSSDWAEVLAEASKYGATPVQRPTALARDDSGVVEAMLHALGVYRNSGVEYDTVCLLNPTSPLRTAGDVLACYKSHALGDPDTTVSVIESSSIRMTQNLGDGSFGWRPEDVEQNRQVRRTQYVQSGSVYIANVRWLAASRTLVSRRSNVCILPRNHSLDIDNEWDLRAARALGDFGLDPSPAGKLGEVLSEK